MALSKLQRRLRIKKSIRKNIAGTSSRPRCSVFRSNKQISAQLIDDNSGITIISVSSLQKEIVEQSGITKIQRAELVGKLLAEKAKVEGIEAIVFDRNGYLYHGRVKAFADSARKNGLKF